MRKAIANLLVGTVNNLAHTHRYGPYPMLRKENVAEHSFFVSLYCLFFYGKMTQEGPLPGLSLDNLLKAAILHDLPEAISGDIVYPFLMMNRHMYSLIDETAGEVLENTLCDEGLALPAEFITVHEHTVMKAADLLHVATRLIEEYRMGNSIAASRFTELLVPGIVGMHREGLYLSYTDRMETEAADHRHPATEKKIGELLISIQDVLVEAAECMKRGYPLEDLEIE